MPEISSLSRRPLRRVLPVPQTAEQLVDVPLLAWIAAGSRLRCRWGGSARGSTGTWRAPGTPRRPPDRVLPGASASVHRQSGGSFSYFTETGLTLQTVQKTGDSPGAVLGEDVDMPVVAQRQGSGQTVQKTVVMPQMQFIDKGSSRCEHASKFQQVSTRHFSDSVHLDVGSRFSADFFGSPRWLRVLSRRGLGVTRTPGVRLPGVLSCVKLVSVTHCIVLTDVAIHTVECRVRNNHNHHHKPPPQPPPQPGV